jgi:hypothetical protein
VEEKFVRIKHLLAIAGMALLAIGSAEASTLEGKRSRAADPM